MKEWLDTAAKFPFRVGDVARIVQHSDDPLNGEIGTIVEAFREGPKGPWVAVMMYPNGSDGEWYAGDLEVLAHAVR
jgi:hypothetical protein